MSEDLAQYGTRVRPAFDEAAHRYAIGGQVLPSVTRILAAVIPVNYHGATEWHMDRGTAVHQCCRMLCDGVKFTHDPQIDGQVQAVKSWLAARKPEIVSVERLVWSQGPIPYAGTLDLLCELQGRLWIIDWKGTGSARDQWQLGGYAEALAQDGIEVRQGLIVELNENGKATEGKPVDLRRARNEWRSILNVFKMKEREGLLK